MTMPAIKSRDVPSAHPEKGAIRIGMKFNPGSWCRGGSQMTFARNLVPTLTRDGAEIVVYTESEIIFDLPSVSVRYFRRAAAKPSILVAGMRWLAEQMTFEKRLRADHCDVLYVPFNHEALLYPRRIPQVVTVHDLIPLVFPAQFPKTSRAWKWAYVPALRRARAIIAVSEHTKSDLMRLLAIPEDKIFVVPDGYSPVSAKSRGELPAGVVKPYLLYVSSSHYLYKNIAGLLHAHWALRHDIPHSLVIVGMPVPRFAGLHEQAVHRFGLGERTVFLSNISDSALATLYQEADLFVYPSLYEGFGMPPLEAMACGVPVVASNRTSIPEVCGDAAFYVDAANPVEVGRSILTVLRDDDLRRNLIAKGRERATKFRWDACASRIIQVCRMASGH